MESVVFQETVIAVVSIIFVAFVIWLLFRRYEVSVKIRLQQAEYRNRLLEKFATAAEFIEFARTPEGQSLVDPSTSKLTSNPAQGVIRTIQVGAGSFFLGVALMISSTRLDGQTDINFIREALEQKFWGTVGISLGIGLILAGLIAYVLAKQMGLIKSRTISDK
jgi:hypothetical protein